MPPFARALPVVLAAVVGCAAPQVPDASPTRAPELGQAAETLAPTVEPAPAESPDRTERSHAFPTPTAGTATPLPADAAGSGASPRPSPSAASSAPAPSMFGLVGAIEDPVGDQGLEGPAHADLRQVTLEDDGERLRVTVTVAGDLPARLRDGEVIGLGIDLLDDGGESLYQLFADGGADGWFAYLQTPDGFVAYPGEFRVGRRVVEFVVPWNHVGSPARGPFSAFLDWSRERPLRNAAAGDRAPDRDTGSFDRT